MVVLDTCALIDLCSSTPTISKRVCSRLKTGVRILSVSFAEITLKIKSGKLIMSLSPEELYHLYKEVEASEIIDIGVPEWLDAIALDWKENKDPADRLIVAYAMKHALPIATTDRKIQAFYKKVIW